MITATRWGITINTHPDTYDELFNSASYLYGGYTPHDTDTEKQYWNWAIESYTVGKNKANDTSDALGRDTEIEANEGSGMAKRTIYEWFIAAQKKLEKAARKAPLPDIRSGAARLLTDVKAPSMSEDPWKSRQWAWP